MCDSIPFSASEAFCIDRRFGQNGKSHEHTNHIEDETFYDFHIHFATERYQRLGTREDAYANPTDRYGDYRGALRCLIDDAHLTVATDPQGEFFFGSRE